ncbi:PorP/SprF family type IX secretion system membrane protein [Galbibacter pacificus]|uniref:PorP/SprF family type IX secretion system membrane protein n=1 Tax=Galbibacter pacificus TaxID=2996052 RepID=A0ABT6FX16_9FLAO|nr:PorP/SprF family type IX secretion system membrane protein [Galbibacter pacificus]MDG3584173.1 PorP/SprF family type IX secretion system membrane protein [Galbibacter pacificus]MDG3587646.1 PorP/SprF family type IX secretion system membrane protein [Galbibacter pacificus]
MKLRLFSILLLLLCTCSLFGQEDEAVVSIEIPAQNLLKFDRFLINPTFSTVNEDFSYLNFYHRNQWVSFEDNYQTYLASYSGRISDRSGLGLSIYHQKFGTISNFGVIANYAYGIRLAERSNLTFGFNLSYYNSGIDKGNINTGQPDDPLIADLQDGSLLTFQPGINLSLGNFDIGVYAENAFDYNITNGESLTDFGDKTFTGHLMYTKRFQNGQGIMEDARLSGLTRARRVGDDYVNLSGSLILDLPKLGWLQTGYDDYYGIAAGIGFNITKRLSLGYTFEKGIEDDVANFGVTHEINFAYSFQPTLSENRVFEDLEEDENLLMVENEETQDTITDKDAEIARLRKLVAENNMIIDEMMFKQDSMEEARKNDINKRFAYILKYINDNKGAPNQQQVKENVVAMMKEMDEDAYKEADKKYTNEYNKLNPASKYSYATNNNNKRNNSNRVSPKPVGKQSVSSGKVLTASMTTTTIANVEDGAYVIANVYKTEDYLNKFLDQLDAQGIDAGYFEKNGLKYVYIKRYDNVKQARQSYNDDLAQTYNGNVWLLNVRNNNPASYSNTDTAYANKNVHKDNGDTKQEAFAHSSTSYNNNATYGNNGVSYCTDRYVARILASDKYGYSEALTQEIPHETTAPKKGYYIIANVFAEDENADRYIKKLKGEGYNAKFFINPKNNYKYVYISKYESWQKAMVSYRENINYKRDIWIMPMKST